MEVDRSLVSFSINFIWREVAIKKGVWGDQSTLLEDMDKLVEDGELPHGGIRLKRYWMIMTTIFPTPVKW